MRGGVRSQCNHPKHISTYTIHIRYILQIHINNANNMEANNMETYREPISQGDTSLWPPCPEAIFCYLGDGYWRWVVPWIPWPHPQLERIGEQMYVVAIATDGPRLPFDFDSDPRLDILVTLSLFPTIISSSIAAEECICCGDSYGDIHHVAVRLPCGHFFGRECLEEWVLSEAPNHETCPMCRQSIYDFWRS